MLSWMKWDENFSDECLKIGMIKPSKQTRRKIYNEYVKEKKMKAELPPIGKMNILNTFPAGTICAGSVCTTTGWTDPCSLGTCEAAPPSRWDVKNQCYAVNKEEGNNPMNYATATVNAGTTETQDQRKYLTQRLETIYYKLEAPLYSQFGLTDDDAPTSPKELAQRIKDGKFVIKGLKDKSESDEFDDDSYFHGYWTSLLRWRDPAKKADAAGYEAAIKELKDLRQKTLDIIKIDEPKAGLDAIKALEAWTPTSAAN